MVEKTGILIHTEAEGAHNLHNFCEPQNMHKVHEMAGRPQIL